MTFSAKTAIAESVYTVHLWWRLPQFRPPTYTASCVSKDERRGRRVRLRVDISRSILILNATMATVHAGATPNVEGADLRRLCLRCSDRAAEEPSIRRCTDAWVGDHLTQAPET